VKTRLYPFMVALLLAPGLWSSVARGDGVVIVIRNTYKVTVQNNTVFVCVTGVANVYAPSAPESESLFLRYDVNTKQLVALGLDNVVSQNSLCPSKEGLASCTCVKDECVPPGTYRYGWSPPPKTCGEIYADAMVTTVLPQSCSSTAPPVTLNARPPYAWDSLNNTAGHACVEPAGGCAMTGRTPAAVLGIDAIALVVGFLLARRRRTR
jgi:hypothetical protein